MKAELLQELAVLNRQLADQKLMADGLQVLPPIFSDEFRRAMTERNRGAARELFQGRLAQVLALGIIPVLEARIVEIQHALYACTDCNGE